MQFNVGDRVYNRYRGFGTVVVADSLSIGVSYDAWDGGHNCGGYSTRMRNGWFMEESQIKLVKTSCKPLDITELI